MSGPGIEIKRGIKEKEVGKTVNTRDEKEDIQ